MAKTVQKKKGGWPKGKPRKPKMAEVGTAVVSGKTGNGDEFEFGYAEGSKKWVQTHAATEAEGLASELRAKILGYQAGSKLTKTQSYMVVRRALALLQIESDHRLMMANMSKMAAVFAQL